MDSGLGNTSITISLPNPGSDAVIGLRIFQIRLRRQLMKVGAHAPKRAND